MEYGRNDLKQSGASSDAAKVATSECDQSARLLRSSAQEIGRLIIPNLASDDAIDKAVFLQGLLEYLAGR